MQKLLEILAVLRYDLSNETPTDVSVRTIERSTRFRNRLGPLLPQPFFSKQECNRAVAGILVNNPPNVMKRIAPFYLSETTNVSSFRRLGYLAQDFF